MTLDAQRTHSTHFRIPADHPAIPGHFPGNPVVPGVIVLDAIIDATERFLDRRIGVRGMPQAKFPASLRPDELARIDLVFDGENLRFRVSRDDAVIAIGRFTVGPTVAS